MIEVQAVRERVARAHRELFGERDITALERYFSPDFVGHSPLARGSTEALGELVRTYPELRHECSRVLQDGNLVAIHGRFTGLGPLPLVSFDIYRMVDGMIVEHWNGPIAEVAAGANGHTQLDGPIDPGTGHDRERNRARVIEFFTHTLIEGNYDGFRRYTDGANLLQHSPGIADGVEPVITALDGLRQDGRGLEYVRIHRTLADGQFVLTHSEGRVGEVRHAYFELWRVQNDHIVELWDAITAVPEHDAARYPHDVF
jgi:predicted SnoaL-like aldol condensation-catalyzing enzyme